MSKHNTRETRLFAIWLRATATGWVLGLPLIVLAALVGEAIGLGGVQFFVGAGMGAGVGLMQGWAIRDVVGRFAPWFWSCVVGLSAPFAVTDLGHVMRLDLPFSIYVAVLFGGLFAGLGQAYIVVGDRKRVGLEFCFGYCCACTAYLPFAVPAWT